MKGLVNWQIFFFYPNPNCNTKPNHLATTCYEPLLATVLHCTVFNAPTNVTIEYYIKDSSITWCKDDVL